MSFAYGITAVLALCMVGVCVWVDKKRDIWLLLLFVAVSVCDLGYFMLSVSKTLSDALTSNRLVYLGSVLLPFLMMMVVLRFCGIQASNLTKVILGACAMAMLAITTSPGVLPIYYSSVDIAFEHGATMLVREYGPLHSWYYVYLFAYMLSMVAVTLYAIVKKKIRSRLHTVLLLCAVFCNISIWLVEQLLPRGFEWLSISYIMAECFVLIIYYSMQKLKLMERRRRSTSYTINLLLGVYLLFFANLVRVITMDTGPIMYEISHVVVLMIYLSILVYWGVSAHDRIMNKTIRNYIIALVALMMFWMLVRTLRHTVFNHVFPIGQWCWYAFYIPMVLIPQLCMLAAKYIGKPEGYKLPRRWYLTYIPSLLLIFGILTNDWHQLAFRFHMGYEAGWDIYHREVLYYAAVVWIFICIAGMITMVSRSCRVPGNDKTIWLPIAMIWLGLFYTVLYTVDTAMFGFIEVTAALCAMVVGIWESCIKTGLIRSNSNYEELMKYSELGVAVVDKDYNIHYCSDDAMKLTKEQMKAAVEGPVMLEGGIRISASPIMSGHSIWQEDLSELMGVLDELTELKEELKDANSISLQNYQMDRKVRALAEKNRLHDEMHRQTARQIEMLNGWLDKLIESNDEKEKKDLVRRIVVVGAYIKRRNNLILVSEQEGVIREEELRLSVQEMVRNLQLAVPSSACSVSFGRDLPVAVAMSLFDFCEYVVETAFDGLEHMLARFFSREDKFYVCVDAVCSLDLTELASDSVTVSKLDDNYYIISFRAEGGKRPC